MPPLPRSQIVPLSEKLGYSLGDFAGVLALQMLWVFLFGFYVGPFGLTVAAAGTLFLVLQVASVACDPVVGLIVDRAQLWSGKFRPWILWTAVPLGAAGFLAFTVPPFGPAGKLAYAYTTSLLLVLVASASHLPYSALGDLLSWDRRERTGISVIRFSLALLAAGAITVCAPSLLGTFGHGNEALGYQRVFGGGSILCVGCLLIAYLTTQERLDRDFSYRPSFEQDVANLAGNSSCILLTFVTGFLFVALALRAVVTRSYFGTYLHRPDLLRAYTLCGLGAAIAGILVSRPIVLRCGRRSTFMFGLLGTILFTLPLAFLPATAVGAAFTLQALAGFAVGPLLPLLWTMTADAADFSEWKNRRRGTALVFSAILVGLKVGVGLGIALGGWLLAHSGDLAAGGQPPASLLVLRLGAAVFPALALLLSAFCLIFYPISGELGRTMEGELAGRRVSSGMRVD